MKQYQVLKNRNFSLLFAGQTVSLIGNSMYTIAFMWMIYSLTKHSALSALWMSLVPVANTIPQVFIAPLAGVMVDRWSKRISMIVSDILRMCLVTVVFVLGLAHATRVWELILVAFLISVISTVFAPSQVVLVRHMLPSEQLLAANATNKAGETIAQLVGPLLGGFIASAFNLNIAVLLDAGTFAISVLTLLSMRVPEPARERQPISLSSIYRDIRGGAQVIFSTPLPRTLTPFLLVYNFLVVAIENILIYRFVGGVLHGGTRAVGLVLSSMAGGELTGSFFVSWVSSKVSQGRLAGLSMMMASLSLALFPLSRSIYVVSALWFLGGLFTIMLNISFFTGIQQTIPSASLGRAWALLIAAFNSVSPVANLVFGTLASVLPVAPIISVLGVGGIITGASTFLTPLLRTETVPATETPSA